MSPPSPSSGGAPPSPDDPLLVEDEVGDGLFIVRCRVRFLVEQGVIDAFRAGLRDLAGRLPDGAGVVVSLAGIEHLASGALLALILFRKQVREERNGEVETCEAVPWVAESFRLIARFAWTPHPTEATAILAVRRALRDREAGPPPAGPPPA